MLALLLFGALALVAVSLALAPLRSPGGRAGLATTLPQTIFPGRWPANRRSPWWEARRRGIYRERAIGPITHMGTGGYYDGGTRLPDGTDHCTHSADKVVASIRAWGEA